MSDCPPKPLANPLNNRTCPLCGADNECAPAARGDFGGECWCASVSFSAELLERVPQPLRGVACVCRKCAQAG